MSSLKCIAVLILVVLSTLGCTKAKEAREIVKEAESLLNRDDIICKDVDRKDCAGGSKVECFKKNSDGDLKPVLFASRDYVRGTGQQEYKLEVLGAATKIYECNVTNYAGIFSENSSKADKRECVFLRRSLNGIYRKACIKVQR